jgi:DNA-binding transcriptional LysR family regulator
VAVAERMLNELHLTVRNLSEVTNEQRGRITIATYSAFAVNPLPVLVRKYRETRPLIEIRIREGLQSEIVEDVRNGAADFGIGYVNTLPDMMEATVLRREALHVLIPSSHPLAAKKRPRIRLAELRDEPMVSAPNDTYLRRLIDGAALSAGFSLHYSVIVDRLLSILHHVFAGVGISVLPSGCLPAIQWGEGCHAALLVEPSLSVTVGLITSRSRYLTPAATSMASLIKEHLTAKQAKT